MDVAATLQALLGTGAPTALPGTAGAAGSLEASFAALFAVASGTDRPAAAAAGAPGDAPPDDHSTPGADEQALSLAGAAAVAAFVSPPAVPQAVPVEAPAAATTVPAAVGDGPAGVGDGSAGAAQAPAGASTAAAPDAATPVEGAPSASTPVAAAAGAAEAPAPQDVAEAALRPVPASTREPAAERAPVSRRPATVPAAEPDASDDDAKATAGTPAVGAKGEPCTEAATRDQEGDAVEGTAEHAAPRRAADRPAPANVNGHGSAPVHGAAPGSDGDVGGREPGRRGTDGAVVVAAARRLGEVTEPRRSGSGADSSAPSSLPPPNPAREPARAEATAPDQQAARTDVERLMRLDELRPVRVRDGGEMRLELSPEGLGRVEVRVAVRADAVHAALYAQQDHARDALVAHRPALEAALGRSQLRLETFSVGLGQHELGDPGRHGTHADPAPDETPARSAARPAPIPAAAPAAALEPPAHGGLSLRA